MTKQRLMRTAAGLLAGAAAVAAARRAATRMSLEGRTALITGGSRGLGLAIARELGRLGAHVTLAARDALELDAARADLEARGIGVSVLVCDLSQRGEAERIVEQVVAERGRLDVLVNNAGVIKVGPFEHMTDGRLRGGDGRALLGAAADDAWRRSRRCAQQGGGRIVNISSIGGKIGVPHLVPYCASKFALTGLSAAMRGELAKDNIRVTTVSPGLMRTGSPFNAWFKGRHRDEFTWFAISDSLPLADDRRGARGARKSSTPAATATPSWWSAGRRSWRWSPTPSAPATVALAHADRRIALLPAAGRRRAATGAHSGWQSLPDGRRRG